MTEQIPGSRPIPGTTVVGDDGSYRNPHCTCVGERAVRMVVDNRGKVHEQCKRCGKRVKQPERIEFDYERVTA